MIVSSCYFWDAKYINTRHVMAKNRRLFFNIKPILTKKRIYFRKAFEDAKSVNQGSIAYNMNLIEEQYNIPYLLGGDINDFSPGIDCSGFIYGLMYYSGEYIHLNRLTTASLYDKLKRDKNYEHFYSAKSPNVFFDVKKLKIGDLILWPSGITDGRNIPGKKITGHVGIVSYEKNGVYYVTHYVNSKKYNHVDIIGLKGAGINTINAKDFIGFKQSGQLNVFRKKGYI
jgi:hypothetical protein